MRLLADRRNSDPIEAVLGTLAYISSEQALRIIAPLPLLRGDQVQLQQVTLNLI